MFRLQLPYHLYQGPSPRDPVLDILRGVIVALMILTHAIFFFHDESSQILRTLGRTGNIICFTAFLFISGISLYYAYLSKSTEEVAQRKNTNRLMKRLSFMLFGYYLTALLAISQALADGGAIDLLANVLEVITLLQVPTFTEFILPFLLYTLLFVAFRPQVKFIAERLSRVIVLSFGLYLIGALLYPLGGEGWWQPYKALLVGDEEVLRFPLFQYAPVLLAGLHLGFRLKQQEAPRQKSQALLLLGTGASFLCMLLFWVNQIFTSDLIDPLVRWPPSIGFLTLGVGCASLLYCAIHNLLSIPSLRQFWIPWSFLGQHAFNLFLTHTILLYFYDFLIGETTSNMIFVVLGFILLITLSGFMGTLHFSSHPKNTLAPQTNIVSESYTAYRLQTRSLSLSVLFLILMLWSFNHNDDASWYGEFAEASQAQNGETASHNRLPVLPTITSHHLRRGVFPWYDQAYPSFMQLEVNSPETNTLLSDTLVSFPITSEMSNATLVYFRDLNYTPVPFVASDTGEQNTITFALTNQIDANWRDNRYFLYYGHPSKTTPTDDPNGWLATETRSELIQTKKPQTKIITATLNRRWHLASTPPGQNAENILFQLRIQDEDILGADALGEPLNIEYRLQSTGEERSVVDQAQMLRLDLGLYEVSLNPQLYAVGEYTLEAQLEYQQETILSENYSLFISHPVYVAWTVDWEGWDVPTSYLNSIDAQVKRHHNIPLTHFFNPRIYLEEVLPPERADYLTRWVRNRPQDEIQLHLHMWLDMVEAAGIPPRESPSWGFIGNGYDVRTDAYTYQEFNQIIGWAEQQFILNGLPRPTGYRAGGWFADEENLQVLSDRGYRYDSSGREQSMWGGKGTSPWNLFADSQPYYPSRSDQNIASDNTFSLLEIPNNGGDAYGYSAGEMIQRFQANYSDQPIAEPRMVNFLTHPQWQNDDEAKMEEILHYTDARLYLLDQGPVVYTTVKDIYEVWK